MEQRPGGTLAALSNDLASAVDAVAAAVVAVEARDRIGSSGFVVAPGTIVTADHAIESDDIEVVLAGGRTVRAQLAGRDPSTDLALLRIDDAAFSAAAIAPSDTLRVGALALAVARDDDGDIQATMGVVGALGAAWRTWRGGEIDRFVRADVSLYPRFSGSPLVDAAGRLIGLNTWGLSRRQALVVPAATISRVVAALTAHGHIARGYLGIALQAVDLPQAYGGGGAVIALGIAPDGPAERGGLIVGDIIVRLGDRRIGDSDDLQAALDAASVGAAANVALIRGGQTLELALTIGERPDADR